MPGASEDGAGGKQSLLLRWFESKLFDMSYAVMYLFNSKESGVQTYIGNRVFSYPVRDVDFYLQQLVNMYIHMHDVAEVIHPYLVHDNSSAKQTRNELVIITNCWVGFIFGRFIAVANRWISRFSAPGSWMPIPRMPRCPLRRNRTEPSSKT